MLREIFEEFDNNQEVWDSRILAGLWGIAIGAVLYGQLLVK
jgi:hypothetical protein